MLPYQRLKIMGLCAALLPSFAFSAKETLHIQIGRNKSSNGNDIEILDTVLIWIDYAKLPEIASSTGMAWPTFEKDSIWVDDHTRNYRYAHNFLAETRSGKGFGSDYIRLTEVDVNCSMPDFIGEVDFTFGSDTSTDYRWDPSHMQDNPEAWPYHRGTMKSGLEQFGQVYTYAKGGTENLTQGQWAKLLIREDGWTNYSEPTQALARTVQTGPQEGWVFNLMPGAQLRAPAGAKALRILDVQGRVQWENRNLTPGSLIALPNGIPRGALRLNWRP